MKRAHNDRKMCIALILKQSIFSTLEELNLTQRSNNEGTGIIEKQDHFVQSVKKLKTPSKLLFKKCSVIESDEIGGKTNKLASTSVKTQDLDV